MNYYKLLLWGVAKEPHPNPIAQLKREDIIIFLTHTEDIMNHFGYIPS